MLSTIKNISNSIDIIKTISVILKQKPCTKYPSLAGYKFQPVILEFKAVRHILTASITPPCNLRQFHLSICTHGKTPEETSQPPKDNDNRKKNKENGEKIMALLTKAIIWFFTIYSITALLSLTSTRAQPKGSTRYVSWNEFVHHMLAVGEVKEIIIRPDLDLVSIILYEGAIVKGRQVSSPLFYMAVADASKFEEKLRNVEKRLGFVEGIPITYDRQSDSTGRTIGLILLCVLLGLLFSRLKGIKGPFNMGAFTQLGKAKYTLIDPFNGGRGVLFGDVAGLKEAKQEVKEFVDYLKRPEKYECLGAKVPKGALLLGPPGCGKTLLAKAVATEAEVPFLSMNGSEFIEVIGGLGAARVRNLFLEGKKRAPCIIYIDEIDAIGRKRSGTENANQGSTGESEQTLNQLLVEMDGMATKPGVLMLASTNRPDVLDKALLRPGRFDRHILIDLPSLEERKEIFAKHLSTIKLDKNVSAYSKTLAKLTPGFSGADIANVCNEAALHAARNSQQNINIKNLDYAVERFVGGTEKRSHARSSEERTVIAYHESGHALVGWLLPNADILLKVSIVPRTKLTLGFAQYTPSEQKLFTHNELIDKMCMTLGGRAAEDIVFNKLTTGGYDDLEKVTKLAYAQVKRFGMNTKVGPMYIMDENDADGSFKPFSRALEALVDEETRNLVASSYIRTKNLLNDNTDKLHKIAKALLDKETLGYDEIVQLIGPPSLAESRKIVDPAKCGKTN